MTTRLGIIAEILLRAPECPDPLTMTPGALPEASDVSSATPASPASSKRVAQASKTSKTRSRRTRGRAA